MPDFDKESFELAPKGNAFDRFVVGDVWQHHWGRTLGEGDNAVFSTATCSWLPMHLNREYAGTHGHPDVMIDPMLVLCTAVGLSVEDLSEAGGPFLGVDNCVFHHPMYPGDTLTVRSEVLDSRSSESRPSHGIVTWRTEGHNQRGELVISYERTNLVAR